MIFVGSFPSPGPFNIGFLQYSLPRFSVHSHCVIFSTSLTVIIFLCNDFLMEISRPHLSSWITDPNIQQPRRHVLVVVPQTPKEQMSQAKHFFYLETCASLFFFHFVNRHHCPPRFTSQCLGIIYYFSLILWLTYNHPQLLLFLTHEYLSHLSTLVHSCCRHLSPSHQELPSKLLQQPTNCFSWPQCCSHCHLPHCHQSDF